MDASPSLLIFLVVVAWCSEQSRSRARPPSFLLCQGVYAFRSYIPCSNDVGRQSFEMRREWMGIGDDGGSVYVLCRLLRLGGERESVGQQATNEPIFAMIASFVGLSRIVALEIDKTWVPLDVAQLVNKSVAVGSFDSFERTELGSIELELSERVGRMDVGRGEREKMRQVRGGRDWVEKMGGREWNLERKGGSPERKKKELEWANRREAVRRTVVAYFFFLLFFPFPSSSTVHSSLRQLWN